MTAPLHPLGPEAGLTTPLSDAVGRTQPSALISHTFSTPRQTTHYIACGPADGPLMIFLHGWPSIGLMWRAQMEAFAVDGWHCVAPDLRGFGGSSAPASNEAYAIEEVVADMTELHDHLGGAPSIWVSHDWGVVVAGELAAHEPERSRGVVLTSLAYQPDGHALRTVLPLVDRTIYPADQYPDGQWDYYRYYATHFEAAVADLDADQAASLASIFRRGDCGRRQGFAERGGHAQRRALWRRAPRTADFNLTRRSGRRRTSTCWCRRLGSRLPSLLRVVPER